MVAANVEVADAAELEPPAAAFDDNVEVTVLLDRPMLLPPPLPNAPTLVIPTPPLPVPPDAAAAATFWPLPPMTLLRPVKPVAPAVAVPCVGLYKFAAAPECAAVVVAWPPEDKLVDDDC